MTCGRSKEKVSCVGDAGSSGEEGGEGRGEKSLLSWGRSLGGVGGDRVGTGTTRVVPDVMGTGAVISGAPPPVVVPANLHSLGLGGVLGASRSDPGFLGWPSRGNRGQ